MRHDTEAAGPHMQTLPTPFFFFFRCFNVCVSVARCRVKVRACCHFLCSQIDTLQGGGGGGGGPRLTLCDKSFSHSQPLSERISLAFNPTFSFIHASAALHQPPPASSRLLPCPPRSPPLHFICILFLGPLISPLSLPLVPFFNLIVSPSLVVFILK